MKFGLCIGVDGLQTAEKAGFDYFEPTAVRTLLPDKPDQDFAPILAAVAASKLKAEAFNVFLPGTVRVTGPDASLDALLRYVSVVAARAAKLGGKVIVFGSAAARGVPAGFPTGKAMDQIAAFLEAIDPIVAKAKINIAIEPLCKKECNIINLVKEGAALATRVNKPNIKALADLYHVGQDAEPYENIVAAGKLLIHAHIANPVTRNCPMPGDGFDYKPFFRALKDAGYNGRISIECAWDDVTAQAAASLEFLRAEWTKA